MGKRGPKPKPAEQKKREGTYRPDRDRGLELPPGLPACPDFLADAAKELWKFLGAGLVKRNVLSDADQLSFALLCQAWADWKCAIETIRKSGMVVTSDSGAVYQHPAVGIRNRSWLNVMKGCQEFGLTPSARTGLEIIDPMAMNADDDPEVNAILGIGQERKLPLPQKPPTAIERSKKKPAKKASRKTPAKLPRKTGLAKARAKKA